MKTGILTVGFPFCFCVALAGGVARVAAQDFWIEAGPAVRGGMQVKVSGSSYVQMLSMHTTLAPLAEPTGAGPRDAYADRLYDNGYVKLDEGTLNPDAIGGPGNTWNWAYNSAGQFNGEANTLNFRNQGVPGYTTLRDTPLSGKDEATGAGIQIRAGWQLYKKDNLRVDLVVGFQGIWNASSRVRQSTYLERKSQYTITDTYNVADTVDPDTGFPPPAPGHEGDFSTPGPVITNVPANRATDRTDLSTAQNLVDLNFETDFYEFTVAPRLSCDVTPHIAVSLTPKIGFAYLDVRAERTETFTETPAAGGANVLGTWRDTAHRGGVRFAAGVTASADFDLGAGYYVSVYGGYEWAVTTLNLQIGPNTASLDGSGYVTGAVVGKRF